MANPLKKEPHYLVAELQKAQIAGLILWYHTSSRQTPVLDQEYTAFCIVKFKEDTTQESKEKIKAYIVSAYKDLSIQLDAQDLSIMWVQRKAPTDTPL